jgi:competence ComEA-like helix-hairpin-helix protein
VDENQESVLNEEHQPEMEPAHKAKQAMLEAVERTYRPEQDLRAAGVGDEWAAEEVGGSEPQAEGKEELARLDLNTATVEELRQLPGIGPALAQRIVAYRTEVHPFEEPDQIMFVSGISGTTYAQIADRLTVRYPGEAEAKAEAGEVIPEPASTAELEEALPSVKEEPEPAEESPVLEEVPQPEGEAVAEEVEEGALPSEPGAEAAVPEAVVPPPAPPTQPPPLRPAAPPPRGDGWGRLLFIGFVSAIAGAILALVVLFVLNNGTLAFRAAASRQLRQASFQLSGEIEALRAELGQMQGQLGAIQDLANQVSAAQADIQKLGGSLTATQTQVDSINSALENMQGEMTNLREDLDGIAGTVSSLGQRVDATEEQVAAIGNDLAAVKEATQRFDAFLAGLRALLEESLGPGPSATLETLTPLPAPTTGEETPTPSSAVTVIPLATYTPTLTATLITPTPTSTVITATVEPTVIAPTVTPITPTATP